MSATPRRATRRHLTIAAWAISLLVVSAATATGASMITGKQIKDGTVTSVDLRNGSVGWADLSSTTRKRISTGLAAANAPSSANAPGAKGDKGDPGANGMNGANGTDAPAREYGIAHVWLDRGTDNNPWATFSTAVPEVGGIPGVASGEFRATCNNAAGCKLYLTAAVASGASADDAKFQAHVQITRTTTPDTLTSTAHTYCEASEVGSIPNPVSIPRVAASATALADSVASPAPRLGQWWGSADCGGTPAQLGAAPNAANTQEAYVLPIGRYNIAVTTRFFA